MDYNVLNPTRRFLIGYGSPKTLSAKKVHAIIPIPDADRAHRLDALMGMGIRV